MDNASDEVQANVRHPRYFGLVTEGISKKQVEKLGRALRAGTLTPHSENWFRFQQYLADQDQVLERLRSDYEACWDSRSKSRAEPSQLILSGKS